MASLTQNSQKASWPAIIPNGSEPFGIIVGQLKKSSFEKNAFNGFYTSLCCYSLN